MGKDINGPAHNRLGVMIVAGVASTGWAVFAIFFDNVNLALAPTVPTLTAPFALVLVAAILGIGTAASIRLRGRSL
jgi:membrane-associated PAP2 superfamily phosphatase